MSEHYEAQSHYANLIFAGLDINPWRHPILSYRAFKEAENFRKGHKHCCQWANEDL